MHYAGIGTAPDKWKAHRFYAIAARAGDAEALNALGACCRTPPATNCVLLRLPHAIDVGRCWPLRRLNDDDTYRFDVRRRRRLRRRLQKRSCVLPSSSRVAQPARTLQPRVSAVARQRRRAEPRRCTDALPEGTSCRYRTNTERTTWCMNESVCYDAMTEMIALHWFGRCNVPITPHRHWDSATPSRTTSSRRQPSESVGPS